MVNEALAIVISGGKRVANSFLSIFFDILIDLFTVVVIIRQGIVNLGQCEVRKPRDQLFRGEAVVEDIGDHGPNRETGPSNDGTSPADFRISGNVRMGYFRHDLLL